MNKKYFVVMRGLPGCGKSTFCKKHFTHNFEIISPDALRIKLNGIVMIDGKEQISQANPDVIWSKALNLIRLNLAMNKNVVLDATSTRGKDIKRYLKIANEYEAEFIVIDFSSVTLDICKERNRMRLPEYTRVGDAVLERMNSSLKNTLSDELQKYVIDYKEFKLKDLL